MSRPPLAPLAEEIPPGILHIELPTPFPVGPVNCWILLGDPLTLVDPGMVIPESQAKLEAALKEHRLRLADVAQVVVTHGHPDHYGAAGWIAEESGATVICGREEGPKLLGRIRPEYYELLARLGIPQEVRDSYPTLRKATAGYIQNPKVSDLAYLGDGDRLAAGGREWTVIETAGHAAGHLSLHDPQARALCSGDHLLPRITPNPVLEPDGDAPNRRHSLIEYLDSLPRFVDLDPAVVLPGHGPAFTDVAQLVANMRRHHEERAEKVVAVVEELGSPTPYEVGMALFPFLEGFAVTLGVSEAIGHLDALAAEGRVRQVDDDPVRFAPPT